MALWQSLLFGILTLVLEIISGYIFGIMGSNNTKAWTIPLFFADAITRSVFII